MVSKLYFKNKLIFRGYKATKPLSQKLVYEIKESRINSAFSIMDYNPGTTKSENRGHVLL